MKNFNYKKHNISIQFKLTEKKCVFSIRFNKKIQIELRLNTKVLLKYSNAVYISLLFTLIPIWLLAPRLLSTVQLK